MRHFALLVSLGLSFLIGQEAPGQTYTITDLGVLPGGSYSVANGINKNGEVTGWADTSTGALHAFLFSNGTMQDLGTLPGGKRSGGAGINASAQVTGWAEISDTTAHAFIFSNGAMQDLGTLPGHVASFGRAINDFGQVTGNSVGPDHAFLFSNGTMYDLGTPQGFAFSSGYAVNNSGQVTGEACCSNGVPHAFLYSNGTMQDLGTLPGGFWSGGRGINNSGQVTGSSGTNDGYYHAFLFSNGTMQDLGTLRGGKYSSANAINQSGQVTGYAVESTGSTDARAFLYSNGSMQDLNDLISPNPTWTLTEGTGINDAGQITGNGILNGKTHAFLLTQMVSDATPPEITISTTPTILWPPNGRMVSVVVRGRIIDTGGSGLAASSIGYAVIDEYRRVQPAGHIALNSAGEYAFTILLQTSRQGNDRNGRQYMIQVRATDRAGNRGMKSANVIVPHDRR